MAVVKVKSHWNFTRSGGCKYRALMTNTIKKNFYTTSLHDVLQNGDELPCVRGCCVTHASGSVIIGMSRIVSA